MPKGVHVSTCVTSGAPSWFLLGRRDSTPSIFSLPRKRLTKECPAYSSSGPPGMLGDKYILKMFRLLWITFVQHTEKFYALITQSSHAGQNKRNTRVLREEPPVFILTWVRSLLFPPCILIHCRSRGDCFLMKHLESSSSPPTAPSCLVWDSLQCALRATPFPTSERSTLHSLAPQRFRRTQRAIES